MYSVSYRIDNEDDDVRSNHFVEITSNSGMSQEFLDSMIDGLRKEVNGTVSRVVVAPGRMDDTLTQEQLNGLDMLKRAAHQIEMSFPNSCMTWEAMNDIALLEEMQKLVAGVQYIVGLYLVDRSYGGPEEGGWYYDTGELVDDPVFLRELGLASLDANGCAYFDNREQADKYRTAISAIVDSLNEDRHPTSSVLSRGVYRAELHEDYAPCYYPVVRPHYE